MPVLIAKSPEFAGKEFNLEAPLISIGRVDGNDIILTHPSVSSRHAELRLEGGDYLLVDHNSTNGTRVNEERITEVMLRHQDVVTIGNIIFSYVSKNALEAAPLPVVGSRVELSGVSSGRPAQFVNLAPFPKPKGKGAAIPKPVLIAAALALGALVFLGYTLFLS